MDGEAGGTTAPGAAAGPGAIAGCCRVEPTAGWDGEVPGAVVGCCVAPETPEAGDDGGGVFCDPAGVANGEYKGIPEGSVGALGGCAGLETPTGCGAAREVTGDRVVVGSLARANGENPVTPEGTTGAIAGCACVEVSNGNGGSNKGTVLCVVSGTPAGAKGAYTGVPNDKIDMRGS